MVDPNLCCVCGHGPAEHLQVGLPTCTLCTACPGYMDVSSGTAVAWREELRAEKIVKKVRMIAEGDYFRNHPQEIIKELAQILGAL